MPESNDTPDGWSEAAAAKQSEALQGLRFQIDAVDRELLALLNRRASLSLEVGRVKANTSGPVFRPQRERQILDNLASENSGPLPEEHLRSIWHEIFASSRTLQRPVSVAYLGPEGTNSYFAAVDLLGNLMDYRPCKNFREAFAAVHGGECALGVIPLENVLQGSVGQCFDLFMEYDVYIQTESVARIQHTLLSVESSPEAIKVVYSHPQALMQSSDFLNQHDWQQLSMENNAVAAQKVRDEKDPSQAAVAGEVAGEIYGLKKLAGPINNCPDNTTRFLILAKDRVYQAGAEKISLCFELPHRSGTLYSMLGNFIFNDVNMRMIESRPIPEESWQYRFFVDIEGNLEDAGVQNALYGIMREAKNVKILGNY